jgi:hypothetical protein
MAYIEFMAMLKSTQDVDHDLRDFKWREENIAFSQMNNIFL